MTSVPYGNWFLSFPSDHSDPNVRDPWAAGPCYQELYPVHSGYGNMQVITRLSCRDSMLEHRSSASFVASEDTARMGMLAINARRSDAAEVSPAEHSSTTIWDTTNRCGCIRLHE
jgi:hypothetical protein